MQLNFNWNQVNINKYSNLIYDNLTEIDNSNPLKKQIAEDIACYLELFNIDNVSKETLLEEKIIPICKTLKGIESVEFDKEHNYYGKTFFKYEDTFELKDLRSSIYITNKDNEFFDHTLSHELGHLISLKIDDKKFNFWNFAKNKGLDECLTEFYANQLDFCKSGKNLDEKYINTIYSDFSDDVFYDIVSDSKFYGNIEGFAYILNSVLGQELIDAKILGKDSLDFYKPYLENLNKDLESLNSSDDFNNLESLNNSLSVLLFNVLNNKYNDKPLDVLIDDYIDLRYNLRHYGNINLQESLIRDLDIFMCEKLLGKDISDCDDYSVSAIINTFDEATLLNNENKKDIFLKRIDEQWIDVQNNKFNQKILDTNNIQDILDMDTISLLKSDFKNNNLREIKNFKLGLPVDSKVFTECILNHKNAKDYITNFNFKGNNVFADTLSNIKNENYNLFLKDFIYGDLFDKSLKNENIKMCSDILKEVSLLDDKKIEKFFEEKKSLIEENPNLFFDSLLYLSSYEKGSNSINKFSDSFRNIDFQYIKNSKGQNFLLYCEDRNFSCNNGRINIDKDKYIGHIEYSFENESNILKTLLSNGFSLEDKDNRNRNSLEIFLERRDLTDSNNKEIFNLMKDVSIQIGNYSDIFNNLSDKMKNKILDTKDSNNFKDINCKNLDIFNENFNIEI